ncbi:hypothetical protein GCM10007984_25050 [Shewanella putrefaciens]|jgi:hypothetical protein|uniref:DUF2835 domain-containing protein n=2 Tax=Shewanella putrefaciens TaxID=24 RepID=E6XN80_SHEP2|nr:hypothetical protein SPWS13_0206 [Shewanella putrefaciens]MDR6964790.1 hypothetical protein [Shewanella putrefaciens]GGN23959.1 hypothetical protein GCM10007984_25050 [Shewanella putrefaciens]
MSPHLLMEFYFKLTISYRDFLPYYQGIADKVEVRESQGRILWINGRHFRRFLTEEGIHGYFKLVVDDKGQFVSLNRV